VRELTDAGINAGVLMGAIVPAFSSSRSKVERTIKAIADHGARFVGLQRDASAGRHPTHFMKFLERRISSHDAAVRAVVRRQVRTKGVSRGGRRDGSGAAGSVTGSRSGRTRWDRPNRKRAALNPSKSDSAGRPREAQAAELKFCGTKDTLPRQRQERLDAALGRRMRAEERRQATNGERLDDEHVAPSRGWHRAERRAMRSRSFGAR